MTSHIGLEPTFGTFDKQVLTGTDHPPNQQFHSRFSS